MAECKYTYKNKEYSYNQLIETLMNNAEIENSVDVLFSLNSKQDILYDQLIKIKKDSISFKSNNREEIDGSPDLEVKNAYTTQTFIDSPEFVINGVRPTPYMDKNNYLKNKIDQLINEHHMPQSNAEAWAKLVVSRWDIISSTATDFHKILMAYNPKSSNWPSLLKNTIFEGTQTLIQNSADAVMKAVMYHNGPAQGGRGRVIKNLNIEAEINTLQNTKKKIYGHIDYMVVRPNGDLEIFNVKTSTENPATWDTAKKEKYKYQLALLKQMLANKGINVRNIRLNIVPVHIKYDTQFKNVSDLTVLPPMAMETTRGKYTFDKYDAAAEYFIDSTTDFSGVTDESLDQATENLQHIFPKKDVRAEGIRLTAENWVARKWSSLTKVLLPNNEGYLIHIPEDKQTITIKDTRIGKDNKEFVEYIQSRIDNHTDAFMGDKGAYIIRTSIENGIAHGWFDPTDRLNNERLSYIREQFSKYITEGVTLRDGTLERHWEMVDSPVLTEANLIAFRHKKTGQFDVFAISGFNVGMEYDQKNQRKNLLGYYMADGISNFNMESNYGNIEAIRVMAVLNEILPNIGCDVKLGQLKIIGDNIYNKKGAYFEFSTLLNEWNNIVQIVNKNTDAKIENKFRVLNNNNGAKCIDALEVLRQVWEDVINDTSGFLRDEVKGLKEVFNSTAKYDGTIVEGLMDSVTQEAKINKLEELISRVSILARDYGVNITSPKDVKNAMHSADHKLANLAKLYSVAMSALSMYYGDGIEANTDFSSLEEYLMKATSQSNPNLRRVGFLVTKSIDHIRDDIRTDFTNNDLPIFHKYYDDCGYTDTQNTLIGNLATAFKNMYEVDENGNNTFIFKNPYDNSNNLTRAERTFLKNILFELYKIKCATLHVPCEVKGADDKILLNNMPEDYLWVPLMAASDATKKASIGNYLSNKFNKIKRLFTNTKEVVHEGFDELLDMQQQEFEKTTQSLSTYNPYALFLANSDARIKAINNKGVSYFETNIENILINLLVKQKTCDEFNRLLIRIRGVELSLVLRGETEGDTATIDKTLKAIDDYVTLNVYNRSIMEGTAQKIDEWVRPFRRLVSQIYIAFNPVGTVRDTFQGLEANFVRALIKFDTKISAKDVAFGYKEVFKEGLSTPMHMKLLHQMNVKYAFSNFDAANISAKLKTARTGLLNSDSWAYLTLTGPDYLNRMVLFVAQLHHDGAFDAYSLDEQGRLKYDWRKDKRFAVLASGDQKNPKYKEQEGLYMSYIRQFNIDNGTTMAYSEDLPDAYPPSEIRRIKKVGESIYGAYDKASRSKLEQTAIGRNFTFFFTWMNGILEDYWKGSQTNELNTELEQETDYNGNKLYWKDSRDIGGATTTEDTKRPVYKNIPYPVQGIMPMLKQSWKELTKGGWQDFKSGVWANPHNRANYRRLVTDMGILLLLTMLFKNLISPAYQEHKKKDKGKDIARNLFLELMYKGSRSSYDVFAGPVALLDYFGNSTNPASYTTSMKLVKQGWDWVSGQRDLGKTLMNSQALFRSAQDTYSMYKKNGQ